MKKVELHVHLNGSLNIKHVNKLMNQEMRDYLIASNCDSSSEYVEKFDLPIKLLQNRQNLMDFSRLLAQDLYEDGVVYAEIRFCPLFHTSILSPEEVVEAVLDGLNEVPEIKTNLILCMMRQFNMTKNLSIVNLAKKYLDKGVVGLDLAGDESRYKTATFRQLFDIIRLDNIPFTIHAGEADGIESINLAIEYGAKRIGHGIRSAEDINTMDRLKENNIVLEICPSSNLDTRVYESFDDYPIRELVNNGVKITINTDNRTVSNTTLEKEYEILKNSFKFTNKEIKQFNINAAEASFLTDFEKAELINLLKDN